MPFPAVRSQMTVKLGDYRIAVVICRTDELKQFSFMCHCLLKHSFCISDLLQYREVLQYLQIQIFSLMISSNQLRESSKIELQVRGVTRLLCAQVCTWTLSFQVAILEHSCSQTSLTILSFCPIIRAVLMLTENFAPPPQCPKG